ncbi:MAG: putative sulfate exporter family transporter, partial [Wenzhouxiangella sp.]|nr:putative sulfate exporter family transporter [Wenzhouxiangella sp.]
MDCTDARPPAGTPVWAGLAVVFGLALLAWLIVMVLARLPLTAGLPLSMMMVALVLGLGFAPLAARRSSWIPGLELARGTILKLAVVLIGLRLSLMEVGQLGQMALPLVLLAILVGLGVSLLLARLFGVERRLATLLAVGTAICGAAAIAATAAWLKARREE